ncbi:unnamed protein product [Fusarium langsethiae]|nr:unnamed protein product [Fusarium langsethiae]
MDSLPLHFRAQLGFLIAISRRSGNPEEHTNTKGVQQPGQPIPSPPNHFDRIPANADVYPHPEREYLVRAQWAIEKLEARLNGQNPILESPEDPQGDTRSKVSLSAWTVEYDGHVQEYQAFKCEWIGVKMTSPKFQAKSTDLQKQLKKVLTILNMEYLTVPNSETRLKIAVYLHNDIATLDQMKAIAALIWTMDPLLLGDIHPRHCGPNSIYSLGLQYSNLVRSSPLCLETQLESAIEAPDPWDNHLSPSRHPLELLAYPGELRGERYARGVDMILDADSVGELIRRLDITIEDFKCYPQASPACKFQPSGKSDEMVIWFNQHCGTLDFTEIKHWISFCVGAIQLSIGETGTSFHKSNPGLTCSSVFSRCLDEIGLEELVDYHELKLKTSRIPDLQYWSPDGLAFSRDSSSYMSSDGSSNLSRWEDSPFPVYEMRFAPSGSGNDNYSFGIELEFYTPTKPDANSRQIDPSPEDDRQIGDCSLRERSGQIAKMITSKGRLAVTRQEVPSDDTPDWLSNLAEHGAVPTPGIAPAYQVWTVLPDYSLKSWEDWAGYAGVGGMEVVSPALGDTSKDWENVVDVLRILRNNFRLLVPNSCGFHIHVAKGTQKLSLHLLRKVVVLVVCAENMIFSLCHPVRRKKLWSRPLMGNGSPLHEHYEETWTRMDVSADFWQYIPIRTASNPRLLVALKKVWMASDGRRLESLLNPTNGKCCISLSKCEFCTVGTEYKGTVEFRFLEGTLDPELIVRWGQLMIALFRFADMAPPEAWSPFVATVSQSQPSGRCDINVLRVFLTLLGLGDDFDFWADKVAAMSRLEEDDGQAQRPDKNQGLLSRIDDSQIAALYGNLCRRERILPCLAAKKGVVQEPEPPVEPVDRAKLILMKAGFGGKSLDAVVKNVRGGWIQARPGKEAREDDTDVASIHLLRVLETSRYEAEKDLSQCYPT